MTEKEEKEEETQLTDCHPGVWDESPVLVIISNTPSKISHRCSFSGDAGLQVC